MPLVNVPTAMQALAALEEWLAADDEARRIVSLEFVETWRAILTRGSRSTEHRGRTLADAIAQAAQVAISDPNLEAAP